MKALLSVMAPAAEMLGGTWERMQEMQSERRLESTIDAHFPTAQA